jgi:phosphatidate cytidylyltransferase
MLKIRVLTALVIGLLTFMVIFLLPPWAFRLAVAILWLTGSWEFTRLAGLGRISRWLLFGFQLILIGLMMRHWNAIAGHALTFLTAAGLTWCVMFLRLVTFRPGVGPGINYRLVSFFCALAGISFAWFALAWLRAQADGEFLILLLIFIIWAADTGAYFTGSLLGKHKLAPSISPGKTLEGLFGGVLLAVLIALLVSRLTLATPPAPAPLIILTVGTVLAAAAGDLFISLHKRVMSLKDTGRIFPGHGGALDRFDSLLTGAPFFALGILMLSS